MTAPGPTGAPSVAYFAAASRGTESVLAAELMELGLPAVEERRGGVTFGERLEHAYRACLWSRVASRVVFPLVTFAAGDPQELYEGVYAIDWTSHLDPARTVAVDVTGAPSPIGSPRFITLKTKDALVDKVRDTAGTRPDVDTEHPDVRISVYVSATAVTVSIDLGGRGLHRRGIGRRFAEAPLKENRAAAILRIAGWPARCPARALFDPFCGSGTFLLEAAWMAGDVAPGLTRPRGGTGWRGHDEALWNRLLSEARDRRRDGMLLPVRIEGSDGSVEAVHHARENLRRAGLSGVVRVDHRDLRDIRAPWEDGGLVVTNPPYGQRLGEAGELGPLYELLGDVLKRRFAGWTAWVFSGNPALVKRIGLRPASRHILYNGPIECRLLEIPIAAERVVGDAGPGWRRPSAEADAFARRLRTSHRERAQWARDGDITCYRLYDSDLPEYNLAVDWYDGAVRVEEYAPPSRIPPERAERRLRDALMVVSEVMGVDPSEVVLRVRRRRSAGEQHQRRGDLRRFRTVREGGLRFMVNLTDYLDTGLFLDDRQLRSLIRSRASGRRFLNLFAHTCTASVAAAAGGAGATTSVELSNVYLSWGKRNFALNGLLKPAHRFVRADVLSWLEGHDRGLYDLILLAPPTFSRSKGMRGDFDVQRDHTFMIMACARLLAPGGEVLFTTNFRDFRLDVEGIRGVTAREITQEVTPVDFGRRPRLRAWAISA
ncbi:MAG: bifunctional 23S rRNA (guanine(2069)-N(7))-methyltransferase RlmK/23S rRNA (guanine(2445)-N(2))-methyltransferase RlmL [Candidatus Eisenbacteria bacterium]|jgi:23S rRNA (guanine2445-N2)-methyltransferase / 23S rRNA (guanine2069-N7)-methyltransferase|nr:bifunctional 23S rRNA (guanine(2069)-N(7))-methyltransferase RlmK/23S rRNA (guanine(2445)-N(2))-methyltransferase RlmL [Candidatus Eisenbacteria bacterium]